MQYVEAKPLTESDADQPCCHCTSCSPSIPPGGDPQTKQGAIGLTSPNTMHCIRVKTGQLMCVNLEVYTTE